jgi:hypothetical protein
VSATVLIGNAAVQLINLQSNEDEKRRFDELSLETFWLKLDATRYRDVRLFALRSLTCFGSTYLCEASFSSMGIIKSKTRSTILNEHLEQCL